MKDYDRYEIGDRVTIERRISDRADGWNDCWASDMTTKVNDGKIYTIKIKELNRCYLEETHWNWPYTAFEPVIDRPLKKLRERELALKELR